MSSRPAVRQLGRLSEIAQVAAKHGFGYLFEKRGHRDSNGHAPAVDSVVEGGSTRGQRLRAMLDELGPTFVKFGQLLSTRPDVIPPDIVFELRGLQDQVTSFPFEDVAPRGRGGARPDARAGVPRVRPGAARRGVDRPGAQGGAPDRGARGRQGAAPRRAAPDRGGSRAALPGGEARQGEGDLVRRLGARSWTSSRARSARSSTTAPRPATPSSSTATSSGTRACGSRRSTGSTRAPASSRSSTSRGRS